MKKLLSKIAKSLVVLEQKDEKDLRQSVLLVDASFILPNNFILILKGVKDKFKNAKISVLTFQNKKGFILENFPDIEISVFEPEIKFKRCQAVIQLLKILRRHFDFIVLSSLDVVPVAFCLSLGRANVFLHNRWLEWYRLRFRTFSDIFKGRQSADKNRRRKNNGITDFLKSLGRKPVILEDMNDENIKGRILIVDNGYTAIDHVLAAVKKAGEIIVNPDLTILTFLGRQQYFTNEFPSAKVAAIADSAKRPMFALAWRMCLMHRYKFGYIVLTTLDTLPAAVALELNVRRVMLYNQWHQWWSLKFKNFQECLKSVLGLIVAVPVAVYLLIASGFILLRTFTRARFINVKNFS